MDREIKAVNYVTVGVSLTWIFVIRSYLLSARYQQNVLFLGTRTCVPYSHWLMDCDVMT